MHKQITIVVEIQKVGSNLKYPVWLREGDSDDIRQTCAPAEKRSDLHPGNDIMHGPARVEKDCADGQIPAIIRRIRKYKGALEHAEDELKI